MVKKKFFLISFLFIFIFSCFVSAEYLYPSDNDFYMGEFSDEMISGEWSISPRTAPNNIGVPLVADIDNDGGLEFITIGESNSINIYSNNTYWGKV